MAPLHFGIQNGHTDIVKFMVENGASVDIAAKVKLPSCGHIKFPIPDTKCNINGAPYYTESNNSEPLNLVWDYLICDINYISMTVYINEVS